MGLFLATRCELIKYNLDVRTRFMLPALHGEDASGSGFTSSKSPSILAHPSPLLFRIAKGTNKITSEIVDSLVSEEFKKTDVMAFYTILQASEHFMCTTMIDWGWMSGENYPGPIASMKAFASVS